MVYSYNKKPKRCTISQLYFGNELYMFRTGLLPIIRSLNPLNAELNPICHLLALLEAHLILRISRRRVNTVLTAIGVFHTSYVDSLLADSRHNLY